ncbi:MAG: DUF2993 domain-containing protein [Armatimonadota bacterium]|nr:DUF2993 domain-containing protein [Armatimonadota bacterium]
MRTSFLGILIKVCCIGSLLPMPAPKAPKLPRTVGISTMIPIIISAALLLAGCGEGYVGRKIEAGVAKRLPDIIGPADSYEVSVSGRTTKMISGRISHMTIHGKGVRPAGDLFVDDLIVDMRDVEFDTDKDRLSEVGETTFEATLLEKSLNQYVSTRQPDLKDLKITLKNGKATVYTKPNIIGSFISASITITGCAELGPRNTVNFVPDKLSVAGISMPEIAIKFVTERINPVMDMSLAKFPATIKSVSIIDRGIKIKGIADLKNGLGDSDDSR